VRKTLSGRWQLQQRWRSEDCKSLACLARFWWRTLRLQVLLAEVVGLPGGLPAHVPRRLYFRRLFSRRRRWRRNDILEAVVGGMVAVSGSVYAFWGGGGRR